MAVLAVLCSVLIESVPSKIVCAPRSRYAP